MTSFFRWIVGKGSLAPPAPRLLTPALFNGIVRKHPLPEGEGALLALHAVLSELGESSGTIRAVWTTEAAESWNFFNTKLLVPAWKDHWWAAGSARWTTSQDEIRGDLGQRLRRKYPNFSTGEDEDFWKGLAWDIDRTPSPLSVSELDVDKESQEWMSTFKELVEAVRLNRVLPESSPIPRPVRRL
jgi:hypothetical protein